MVTSMVKIITLDVYALFDPEATLSFGTPLFAKKFDDLHYMLYEQFLVSNPVGESLVAKRVYRKCPISLPIKDSYVDLLELAMHHFYIILGIDWFHLYFAFNNCRTRVVTS